MYQSDTALRHSRMRSAQDAAATRRRPYRHRLFLSSRSLMLAGFTTVALLSVSTFNELILPAGALNLQQYVAMGIWLLLIVTTIFVKPILRVGTGTEAITFLAFCSFVPLSVLWSDLSSSTLMKGVAIIVTTVGAYRIATRMRVEDIVDSCIAAFSIVAAASLLLVFFVPSIGIDHTYFHEGEWQGIFASKQSLGTVSAFLMFFAFHRVMTRGGRIVFSITFALALVCVVGSGSRGGGALAFAACVCLYLSSRSQMVTKVLAFGPSFMTCVAIALISYLVATGHEYIPMFGVKVDFTERAIIWQYALSHFVDHSFLGYGLNGFWSIDQVYHNFERGHGWVLDNYHNGYIAILVEIGIAGLTLFSVSTLLLGIKMWRVVDNKIMHRSYYIIVICLINMTYFIDFTESIFLRSTNINSVLLIVFCFIACAAASNPALRPATAASRRHGTKSPVARLLSRQSPRFNLPRAHTDGNRSP